MTLLSASLWKISATIINDALQIIIDIHLHKANLSAHLLFKAQQMEYYLQSYLQVFQPIQALWPDAFWLAELVSLRCMAYEPGASGTWYNYDW